VTQLTVATSRWADGLIVGNLVRPALEEGPGAVRKSSKGLCWTDMAKRQAQVNVSMQDRRATVFLARAALLSANAPQRVQWGAGTVTLGVSTGSLTRGVVGRRLLLARPTPTVWASSRAASSSCALKLLQRALPSLSSARHLTIRDGFTL